jgi:tetratricopeptide (TPR) repeat protein
MPRRPTKLLKEFLSPSVWLSNQKRINAVENLSEVLPEGSTMTWLAQAYFEKGQFEKAKDTANKALALSFLFPMHREAAVQFKFASEFLQSPISNDEPDRYRRMAAYVEQRYLKPPLIISSILGACASRAGDYEFADDHLRYAASLDSMLSEWAAYNSYKLKDYARALRFSRLVKELPGDRPPASPPMTADEIAAASIIGMRDLVAESENE